MSINRSSFIFAKPVILDLGTVRFLTVEEYMSMESDLALIAMNTLHLFYAIKKASKLKEGKELNELRKMKEVPLYELVTSDESLILPYYKIFQTVIDYTEGFSIEDIFKEPDRFMSIRKLVMDMNLVKEEKVFADERLQKGEDMKKMVESSKVKEKQTVEDIVSSIVANSSHTYEDVERMTVYQMHTTFARINAKINYDTQILFRSVGSDDEVEHWAKHIDLLAEEKSKDMNRADFERKYGEILS